MTKEEAVRIIKHHMEVHKLYEERAIKITEALEMAIKALENEPYKNYTKEDYKNWEGGYE